MRNDQDISDQITVQLPDNLFYAFMESVDQDRRMIERYAKDDAK
jgi:hypothetical protein